MKPKRGMIVDFNHVATAGGNHTVSPAIVHSVNPKDGTLMLHVLMPAGMQIKLGVTQGPAPNQWEFVSDEEDGVPSELPPMHLPSSTGNATA